MLTRVSYISTATRPMRTDDLMAILKVARERNADQGITGMLLYGNGTFVQVLEGEKKALDDLLEIIKKDPRHSGVRILEQEPIAEREYAEWSMAFKRIGDEDLRNVPGLSDFFEKDFSASNLGGQLDLINKLLGHFRKEHQRQTCHEELSLEEEDAFIVLLHRIIRSAVKVLAVLMVFTILWSVLDVGAVIYKKLLAQPITLLVKEDILKVFGSFMIVLIAIEIFINITLYIRSNVIPVKLVVATALMAVARKIIVFDYHDVSAMHVLATGVLLLALGGTYWLLEREFHPHGE